MNPYEQLLIQYANENLQLRLENTQLRIQLAEDEGGGEDGATGQEA